MVAEDIDLVTEHRMENGLNTQMVFQDETLQFSCGGGASQGPERRDTAGGKIREVGGGGIVGEKTSMFSIEGERFFATQSSEFRHNMYENPGVAARDRENRNWHNDGSSDGSDGDDDDEDDDEEGDDEGDEEVEGLVGLTGGNQNDRSGSGGGVSDNLHKDLQNNHHHHSSLELHRGFLSKEGNGVSCGNGIRGNPGDQHHQQGSGNHYENEVAITGPEMYYSQFQQGPDGSALGQKDIRQENGCGFLGGKESSLSVESNEPLRAILTDPITGTLMDDAMILPCGHSFGSGGMQHVIRMKACYTCSQSVTEDSVAPNLSLRSAIQAFRREEELHSCRVSKKRRERFEQDKSSCGELSMYLSRGKGVQFPFAVTDRVIIKGNKRTPLRFVGREAVVTTQCLNGWYVVKTLDNAESVKLQYRSLAKVSDSPSSNMVPSKTTPNWL